MKAGEIYLKTSKFMWLKLGLEAATVLAIVILFAISIGIGVLCKSVVVLYVMFFIWCTLSAVLSYFVNHYFAYLIKAGHVAVITEAVTSGKIPENQFEFGKKAVKERFVTSNVYFALDKLVNAAVKQIQKVAGKLTSFMGNIPVLSSITKFLDMFIGIVLGYVDECCLGWTFYKKDENAFKAGADGVVIYFQNWKAILKSAALAAIVVAVLTLALTVVVYIAVYGIIAAVFASVSDEAAIIIIMFAIVIALRLSIAIKNAFVDSWILCKMMTTYMEVAPSTQITFDLYDKLCNISNSFKKMFKRAGITPETATATAGVAVGTMSSPVLNTSTKYCTNCGAMLDADAAFCGQCGTQQ